MYTINCLLEGGEDPFSVEIDDTQPVDKLKDVIKTRKAVALAAVDANNRKLYHANLEYDESDEQEHFTQANEVLQGLSKNKPLNPRSPQKHPKHSTKNPVILRANIQTKLGVDIGEREPFSRGLQVWNVTQTKPSFRGSTE
jgi:hypothetical protein